MKISEFESGQAGARAQGDAREKILPKEFRAAVHETQKAGRARTSREEAFDVAMKALETIPDVREDLVEEVRAKIESGQYEVDPSEVGEMMLRRMRADGIR